MRRFKDDETSFTNKFCIKTRVPGVLETYNLNIMLSALAQQIGQREAKIGCILHILREHLGREKREVLGARVRKRRK